MACDISPGRNVQERAFPLHLPWPLLPSFGAAMTLGASWSIPHSRASRFTGQEPWNPTSPLTGPRTMGGTWRAPGRVKLPRLAQHLFLAPPMAGCALCVCVCVPACGPPSRGYCRVRYRTKGRLRRRVSLRDPDWAWSDWVSKDKLFPGANLADCGVEIGTAKVAAVPLHSRPCARKLRRPSLTTLLEVVALSHGLHARATIRLAPRLRSADHRPCRGNSSTNPVRRHEMAIPHPTAQFPGASQRDVCPSALYRDAPTEISAGPGLDGACGGAGTRQQSPINPPSLILFLPGSAQGTEPRHGTCERGAPFPMAAWAEAGKAAGNEPPLWRTGPGNLSCHLLVAG